MSWQLIRLGAFQPSATHLVELRHWIFGAYIHRVSALMIGAYDSGRGFRGVHQHAALLILSAWISQFLNGHAAIWADTNIKAVSVE